MKPNRIRPIAICLFRNGDRILVSDGVDPKTGSPYCRPLGGSIEFGERAQEAVVREIREELGVEIREVRLLGVLENLFTLDGQQATRWCSSSTPGSWTNRSISGRSCRSTRPVGLPATRVGST
jgi:ADP-ribose pyrophosphatase YjhB (NUDIX family)